MRVAIDTGGTFTDLTLVGADGRPQVHKAPTVPSDPAQGVLDVLAVAARARDQRLTELLADVDTIVHGTTIALNAVVTGHTARTAFVTTRGHPDILTLREGGRLRPFDHTTPFPSPYVPRDLTFEVEERVTAEGTVSEPLTDAAIDDLVERLRAAAVEAVAVCLLWSVRRPDHELRIGAAIEASGLDVHVSLSHRTNPIIREYRRASSTCLDASLKPIVQSYLGQLERRLVDAGFDGRLLVVTSQGGVREAADIADHPVHAIGSGPAMAPIAGSDVLDRRQQARPDGAMAATAIVIDTGGTTFDVSVVRDGEIPRRTDTWIGEQFSGHMTGFPAVDVSSVGAGGGSIARVDQGGLLEVGPESAGADPGPVCFGRGGRRPTFTDACLVLGLLDPDNFFAGGMRLDTDAARRALDDDVGRPLGLTAIEAAEAVYRIGTEAMVTAVEDVTIARGIDPRDATLIAGGGAAGLNAVEIGRRLGCRDVVLPLGGAALSAVGGLHSALVAEHTALELCDLDQLDPATTSSTLDALGRACDDFADRVVGAGPRTVSYAVDARYRSQVWEIDVAFERPTEAVHLARSVRQRFDDVHRGLFGFADPASAIDVVAWRARVSCPPERAEAFADPARVDQDRGQGDPIESATRSVRWPGHGDAPTELVDGTDVPIGWSVEAPAVITTSYTTLAVPPGARVVNEPVGLVASWETT